jgi:RHS repeat-associated protein
MTGERCDSVGIRATFVYDGEHRCVNEVRATTSTYTYAFDGLRRSAQQGGAANPVTFVWDGTDLLNEYILGGASTRYDVLDGEVIAEKRGANRYVYGVDPLGSVVHLLDSGLNRAATYVYWPYGEVQSHTGVDTPMQFVGRLGYYTSTTNRVYVRARWLRPDLARWLTEDPTGFEGGDLNLGWYARCRAPAMSDPSGLAPAQHRGVGSCYGLQFQNCCTSCGTCFNQSDDTAAALPDTKGHYVLRCHEVVKCCQVANPSRCLTVTITDKGGEPGRLIDFGCAYLKRHGWPPKVDVSCRVIGWKPFGRECQGHPDCGKPPTRGCLCGGKLGSRLLHKRRHVAGALGLAIIALLVATSVPAAAQAVVRPALHLDAVCYVAPPPAWRVAHTSTGRVLSWSTGIYPEYAAAGSYVVTCGQTVDVWYRGRLTHRRRLRADRVIGIADGRALLGARQSIYAIRLHDARDTAVPRSLAGSNWIGSARAGTLTISDLGGSSCIRLLNHRTRKLIRRWQAPTGLARLEAWGNWIAGLVGRTIWSANVVTGGVKQIKLPGQATALSICPDGRGTALLLCATKGHAPSATSRITSIKLPSASSTLLCTVQGLHRIVGIAHPWRYAASLRYVGGGGPGHPATDLCWIDLKTGRTGSLVSEVGWCALVP